MASKTPIWVWVVFGLIGFLILCVAAVVGGGIWMVRSHVHTVIAEKPTAQLEFNRARSRFAGQQPLVELKKNVADDDRIVVHRPPDTTTRRTDLQTIKILFYDAQESRLVHIDVPLWIMRLLPQNRIRGGRSRSAITWGDDNFDFNSGALSLEDIERHGPGLVVDGIDSHGAQVLVWAE